jgi:hypothetical protein
MVEQKTMGDRRADAIFNSTQNYNPYSNISITESTFPVEHNLTVEGRAIIQGRDILEELDEMRDALLLLKRDVDMEAKYPKLRELKDAYEAELEKYKTFEALK